MCRDAGDAVAAGATEAGESRTEEGTAPQLRWKSPAPLENENMDDFDEGCLHMNNYEYTQQFAPLKVIVTF